MRPGTKLPAAVSFIRVSSANVDNGRGTDHAKSAQQPQNDRDDHDNIQNRFDLVIHGNVLINQPQDDTDHDQNDDNID